MKKIMAVAVVCSLMVTYSICAFAEGNATGGNAEAIPSITAAELRSELDAANAERSQMREEIEGLRNDIQAQQEAHTAELQRQNAEFTRRLNDLANKNTSLNNQLKTAQKNYSEANTKKEKYEEKYKNATSSSGSKSRPENSSRVQVLSKNNAIGDGYGGYIAQGGHVQINGGKSNVTFTLSIPASNVVSSANKYASDLGGTLLYCVSTSSPGVSFKNAVVNFTITGVPANDTIAAYQLQGKNWVQVRVTSVTNNHVSVELTQHGPIAFVRVAAVANATH
ncbi:MAG: hypothetical protein J5802_12350 [Butyrivibrio sp.]|nr:hypothetical protein [Butyrivibrio sp.]